MKRIIIFASGSGTNAENIIKYFKNSETIEVVKVLSNNKNAQVLERAKKLNMACDYFTKSEFENSDEFIKSLQVADYIILAGFLWKIPSKIIEAFPNKIINIHPALLPKYGGKGMYGMNIHNEVYKDKESETGITIHFVNENYDEGAIIFQQSVKVLAGDSPEEIAQKVHQLEYTYFPEIIEKTILKNG